MGKKGAIAVTAAALSLGFAASADALVYWGNFASPGAIGRADLDGSDPNQAFIEGADQPCSVAIDAQHVYWGQTGTIGRADLNGGNVDQSFITLDPVGEACGVDVDANFIYWTNSSGDTIGRANLDGTSPNQSFITGADDPRGVAVDANFIYWDNQDSNKIGRAELDGDNPNQIFITTGSGPEGVAVDSSFIYWSNQTGNSIGRAELDGDNPNNSFITGLANPCGVAVDASSVYWVNNDTLSTVGRANLDGTSPNQSFIAGATFPCGIAVSSAMIAPPACSDDEATVEQGQSLDIQIFCLGEEPVTYEIADSPEHGLLDFNPNTGSGTYSPNAGFVGSDSFNWTAGNAGGVSDVGTMTVEVVAPEPAGEFTLGKAKRNKKKGTAKLTVEVPGPGALELSGKKVKPTTKEAATEGAVKLPVKPKGKAKQKLADTGKAKVKVEVSYTPDGGDESTQSARIKLVKR
jgi:hypothetical protein